MTLLTPTRRGFLGLLGFVAAAPAIIKVSALMPVQAVPFTLAHDMVVSPDLIGTPLAPCGRGMSAARFRELLMPGLMKAFEVNEGRYAAEWEAVFNA